MKKRLLSIITSVSMLATAFAFGADAAPSVAGSHDSATDFVPMPEVGIEETENMTAELSGGPSLVDVADSAIETNTEFGKPEFWEGAVLMADLQGEGTQESPYLIGSANELQLMANNINSAVDSKAHYKLTNDIDLGGAEWTPIGYVVSSTDYSTSFGGVFDGDGHTISNFKITKDDTAYLGLFGHISGGTVKNLNIDNVVIDINSDRTQRLYAGILSGRLVTTESESTSSVTNCNVTNSSITITSKGTLYAGGLAGSVISGDFESSSIFIAFVNAECDVDISSTATNMFYNPTTSQTERHMVIGGGLVGYLSAQTYSKVTFINSNAKGNITANTLNSIVAQPLVGAAFGDARTVDVSGIGGTMTISACSSHGTVTASSDFYPYVAGGFAGQIYATRNFFINDCNSSADVNGKYLQAGNTRNDDPTAGGFVGQVFFPNYSSSFGKTIKNCFGNGDVTDLTHTETTPKDCSFVGGFTGYSQVGVFENCYRFDSQKVWGSDILETTYIGITALSEEESKLLDKYIGFDFENIWEMDPEAEYFYPVLREKLGYVNFISEGVSFATATFDIGGRVSAPEATPSKDMTVDKVYSFNYWSLTEDGTPFNFAGDTLSENTTLYAVFKSVPRQYKVRFINEGADFVSAQLIDYGSVIRTPVTTPEKATDDTYYYTFLYWSETPGGEKFDFTEYTLDGTKTFYAVYNAIDKSAWTGGVATEFESGFGTEQLPYIIKTSDEFALFAKVINEQQAGYTDAYYALGADINLGGNIWLPIGNSTKAPFSAHFDGKGYSVGNFKVADTQYAGLFGYVYNGTIKNVYVTDFVINLSPVNKSADYNLYVGGLAGCVESKRGTSEISGIRVSAAEFKIDANIGGYIYTGNIAGYGSGLALGKTLIHDSFATSNITVSNETGYSHVGGIVGRFDTGSSAVALISRCYYTGNISSTSFHSSYAGGLVGYLFSFGSQYVSSSDTSSDDSATLAASDVDIMIEDSFAIPTIYSNSTNYYSRAGRLIASINNHASYTNIFYPNARVMIDPERSENETEHGGETDLSNLMNEEFLAKSGFDFTNTWTYVSGYDYPVLKCMVADKPIFKITSTSLSEGTLNATVQVLSNAEKYTVIIGVYNERNQLIGARRINLKGAEVATDVNVSFDNIDKAHYIAVSAIDASTLSPLFEGIRKDI